MSWTVKHCLFIMLSWKFSYYNFILILSVAVASILGTLVAFLIVPMRSLGPDNWKVAAALMGSYIGGCKFFNKLLQVSCSLDLCLK